ncbi:MAG: 4-hydroxythreonine-4-phosphate dehydrogenase PdxA [Saprospiraceae bacterium]
MNKLKIGISIGDINGIGLEVILKTIIDERILKSCTPIIYGSSKVVSYHKNIVSLPDFQFQTIRSGEQAEADKINIVNCWNDTVNITLGKLTDVGGIYAIKSLEAAMKDLKAGFIDALVTAPINKKAMQLAGFPFPGHTEYISQELGAKDSLMLLVNEGLRVGVVTGHIPLKSVSEQITKTKVIEKIKIFNESLIRDFAVEKPLIAVLGLNPHAGDEGVIGQEELEIIRPAIEEVKKRGVMAFGPYPADGFFGSGQYKKFHGILAMYHDQGLVAFKSLSFGSGINYTAGLSAVRTSPDHGTAYDIAGKNEADPSSFRKSLFAAIDIAANRKEYAEDRANPLVRNKTKFDVDEVLKEENA